VPNDFLTCAKEGKHMGNTSQGTQISTDQNIILDHGKDVDNTLTSSWSNITIGPNNKLFMLLIVISLEHEMKNKVLFLLLNVLHI
jgi:hypothetical protein